MLVLSRHKEEQIVIDGNIVITVVKIQGESVRIGIDAPEGVGVWRAEIPPELRRRPDKDNS